MGDESREFCVMLATVCVCECSLDQTLGKPGAWMVTTENEKQRLTVVVRLSRLESQASALLYASIIYTTVNFTWLSVTLMCR